MINDQKKILSTKILDEGIVQQAAFKNIIIDCIPFIQIKTIDTPVLQHEIAKAIEKNDHIIFTSANAVEAVAKQFNTKQQLNVFCISGKTRKAVEENFPSSNIITDAPNGYELAEKIINSKIKSAVFFCSDRRLNTIPEKLSSENILLNEIIVYETVITPQRIEKNYEGVLFFSPSGVDSFFSVNTPAKCPVAFSLAGSTYNALQPIIKEITICQIPSEQGMLNAVIDYYKSFL